MEHPKPIKIDFTMDASLESAVETGEKGYRRLAPAYETASTRRFFHGRTETVRSCTASLAKLVRLIIDDSAEACSFFSPQPENGYNAILQATFVEAYETHNQLMAEAMEGRGQFVGDVGEHWEKNDCSFVGYDVDGSYGYVAPMCEDGYGVFYKIGPDRIIMALSAFTTSKLTNLERMIANVHWSLEYLSQFFPITSRM
uniref:Choline/carnitine acyltransferase domain-containing protein n=1 Tax=Parascaris equorum TaxID=6256 RepID=A0A914RS75_PAREQ